MTHFELNQQTSTSALDLIREARDYMPGHTLRVFVLAFVFGILPMLTALILNIREGSVLEIFIKLFIVSLVSMFGHVTLYGQAANIAAGLDSESASEFRLDQSRILKLIGLDAILFCVSFALPYAASGFLVLELLSLMLSLIIVPLCWFAPLAVVERNCDPIDAIIFVYEGLKGRRILAFGTLFLGSLIACLVAMTIVGIIWAAPFSYFLTSVLYRKLIAGSTCGLPQVTPRIQIQMPLPTRRVVREI